jgi:antitoxin (DNA-binding transcriptional repressor) of toxin-antitoxin stability system
MESVTAFEAQSQFPKLLARVEGGEEVVITRREKVIARMVPEIAGNSEAARRAVAGLDAIRERIAARPSSQSALTAGEVKSAIEEGRH